MPNSSRLASAILMLLLLLPASAAAQSGSYPVSGMVVQVDAGRRQVVVSHNDIAGLMPAMTMPFEVRVARELDGLEPGMQVDFTLNLADGSAWIEGIEIVRYQSVEQDPFTARRLRLLRSRPDPVAVGDAVPDFTLTTQAGEEVTLSDLHGKVVAANFIYTSCALPEFCYRVSNHFGAVLKRFASEAGRDLVLLTITFDPARDTPEVLADYASQWAPPPGTWHFLTGSVADVDRVSGIFGVDFFPDEGLMNHSVRTVVIGRDGRVTAAIEGNDYTAAQLGDLVEAALAD